MDRVKAVLAGMTATETTLLDRRLATADRLSVVTRGLILGGCVLSLKMRGAAPADRLGDGAIDRRNRPRLQ
jgi:hypothetical protein